MTTLSTLLCSVVLLGCVNVAYGGRGGDGGSGSRPGRDSKGYGRDIPIEPRDEEETAKETLQDLPPLSLEPYGPCDTIDPNTERLKSQLLEEWKEFTSFCGCYVMNNPRRTGGFMFIDDNECNDNRVNVYVENGYISAVKYAYDIPDYCPDRPFPNHADYKTMEEIFNTLYQALLEGAAKVTVSYDEDYHYIKEFFVDRSECIADEEFGFALSDFAWLSCCDSRISALPVLAEVEYNEAIWEEEHADDECYCYVEERLSFTLPCYIYPKRICVEDGLVVDVTFEDESLSEAGGECEDFEINLEDYRTVPEIFDFIESTAEQGVHSLTTSYADDGFPTLISIDYLGCAIDDEITYKYRDLVFKNCCDFKVDPTKILYELDRQVKTWGKDNDCYCYVIKEVTTGCDYCVAAAKKVCVEYGEVVSVSYVDDGDRCDDDKLDVSDYWTVPDMHDYIRKRVTEGVARIEVLYNSIVGYPIDIFINADECDIGDEKKYVITDFYREYCCDKTKVDAELYLGDLDEYAYKWRGVVKDRCNGRYGFVFRQIGFIDPCYSTEYKVEVNDGKVTSVVIKDEKMRRECGRNCRGLTDAFTLEELFYLIKSLLENGLYSFNIAYDKDYGHIEWVNYEFEDPECLPDAAGGYIISDVVFH